MIVDQYFQMIIIFVIIFIYAAHINNQLKHLLKVFSRDTAKISPDQLFINGDINMDDCQAHYVLYKDGE